MRLKNKIALITGAAGGIGRSTAVRFAEEGATVVACDINLEGARETLREVESAGAPGTVIGADLTRENEVVGLFEQITKDYGQLDILVTIAGSDFEPMVGIDEISAAGIDRNIHGNLTSCILCCREAYKIMMNRNYGKIVNMCSILYRGGPTPMQHTYAAAKGGIYAFTRGLAMNLGLFNINVNAVAPSLVEVDVIKNSMDEDTWNALKADCESRYPLGRIGRPSDVANCILFLASDEASFITGQVIEVSGGARL